MNSRLELSFGFLRSFTTVGYEKNGQKENNTQDSNVVPHRSTNWARTCLTSLSRREAVLSCWYGRSQYCKTRTLLCTLYMRKQRATYAARFCHLRFRAIDEETQQISFRLTASLGQIPFC